MSDIFVHGLGYIGLPTAAMFANYDHSVVGYDTDESVIEGLEDRELPMDEPGLRAFVTQAFESGNLDVTSTVEPAKYHIVCVPTPFDADAKRADLNYVRSAGEAIRPHLRVGDTVILESTVPPGTTEDVLRPVLETDGLRAGDEFALVHCPETVLPGNIITEMRQNARIIGGVNGVSTEAAVRLYDSFVEGEIRTTSDATTAEFVKLIQNTFRDTNIALANEIAKLTREYGIDSREAIGLANEHPRVNIHRPGPGVGGHCLPVDPWFLGQRSDELDLIARARRVNDGMAAYVADLLDEELGGLAGTKIAVLGVAYKGNIGDARESPGLRLAEAVRRAAEDEREATTGPPATDGGGGNGRREDEANDDHDPDPDPRSNAVRVGLHDPHVANPAIRLDSLADAVDGADALVVTTDHDEFESLDTRTIADGMAGNLVIDTKAVLDADEWAAVGIEVERI
ncbi:MULTISPECIES: nucleotide sugar dehydrogenase [unclassified Haladaptatus]|uniref:nucleotide sugar dehydrogenase n=1 Tax=unclassified Haladaptatus TaxID=2622732 RepID=UPI00209C4650|nr:MULTISPECIES: nucleotide sugar dehydrogenase [unclassified Haladaptatus]MCO8245577.1 nucleotide sugar dehydrogenase [Haladaptatus sp. AB643]MCO8255405.1 nucleotide sugar dehydrogenase [Haladaptatus sp. AB618]